MTFQPHFILASGSPRRAFLLSAAGYVFSVEPSDVDETKLPDEKPADMVLRLASAKSEVSVRSGAVVLAADTVVVRDGNVLGKPTDREDAVRTLLALEGRVHSVLTGWSIRIDAGGERFGVSESRVTFTSRTERGLRDYVDRVQPFDKAGAYALQGDDGWLVASVSGSRANVMGLPLRDIAPELEAFGVLRSAQHS
jgi:septum formation protein